MNNMRIELTQSEAIELFNSFGNNKKAKIFKRALKNVIGRKEYKRFKKNEMRQVPSIMKKNKFVPMPKEVIKVISKKLKNVLDKKDYFPTLLIAIKRMRSNGDKNGYLFKLKKSKEKVKKFNSSNNFIQAY